MAEKLITQIGVPQGLMLEADRPSTDGGLTSTRPAPPRVAAKLDETLESQYEVRESSDRTCRDGIARAMDIEAARDPSDPLAQLIDLAFEPIFIWHTERGIVTWNSGCERLYGYSRAEAIGRISHDLLNTRFPVSKEDFEAQLVRNKMWLGELRHTAKDGRGLVVESRHQLLRVDGEFLVFEANRDITERKLAEERLKKSEDALRMANIRKDQFIAVLAHELRNPLAPIRSGIDLLKREGEGVTPRCRTIIDIMDRQTAHLIRLVDDLLEISRIARGKLEFRMQAADLRAILGAALEACHGNIERKNHSLTTDISASKLSVLADPIRLTQAFTNVLNNAAKYTPRGGAIRVSAHSENGHAVVTISDTDGSAE